MTPALRRDLIRVLGAFAALVVGTTAAGWLVWQLIDGTAVTRWDDRVVADLVEGRRAWLDDATGWATWLSDTISVAVVWLALVAWAAWRWRNWVPPAAVMVAIGGEKLSYLLTSIVADRPRPSVPPLGEVHATTSFPSGHTASAVSVYGVVVLLALWSGHLRRPASRMVAAVAVVVVTAVVAFGRVYRGHHHPSDVVAGAVLGVVWLLVAWVVVLRARPPQADRSPAPGDVRASSR